VYDIICHMRPTRTTRRNKPARKTQPVKPPLRVLSCVIGSEHQSTLSRIKQDLTDYTGRPCGASVVIRAFLAFAKRQDYEWICSQLGPRVMEEIERGLVWGRKGANTHGHAD
jgi:hypothetical protein